jgi:adenylate kinase
MFVVMVGPPGCGKGTQSQLLSKALGIPALSTGEILRAVTSSGSDLGGEVTRALNAGALVSDDLVNRVVADRLAQPECARGAILDGYPRTGAQAEFLDRLIEARHGDVVRVLHFEIDEATLFSRLTARRYCPVCGRIYNLVSAPPAHMDYCDDDGMVLVHRTDDQPEVVRDRVRIYEEQTAPVLQHYRGLVHRIDAAHNAQEVFAEIESRLGVLAAH